jgi:hypothetical protein
MAKLTERTSFTKDVQGRYLCNDVSIGFDEANDFIFGELQNALRRQRLTISARSPPLFRLPRCHPRRCSSPVRTRHNLSV